MKNKSFELSISRTGIPCLWEEGGSNFQYIGRGGWSNIGKAVIVTAPDASPMKPIYVRKRGSLACSNHALIPVSVGSIVINAQHHRDDFSISVWQIKQINGKTAKAEMIGEYSLGEWVFSQGPHPSDIFNFFGCEVADHFRAAIEAACKKANCYHCKEPHYVVRV